eukprot:161578-Lingulodinium_polyedra.AAC.1
MLFPEAAAVRMAVKRFSEANNGCAKPAVFPTIGSAFGRHEDPGFWALEQCLHVRLFGVGLFARVSL